MDLAGQSVRRIAFDFAVTRGTGGGVEDGDAVKTAFTWVLDKKKPTGSWRYLRLTSSDWNSRHDSERTTRFGSADGWVKKSLRRCRTAVASSREAVGAPMSPTPPTQTLTQSARASSQFNVPRGSVFPASKPEWGVIPGPTSRPPGTARRHRRARPLPASFWCVADDRP